MAPGRISRPFDTRVDWEGLPDHVATCPFCPGNEAELPQILWELEGPDGSWAVRSVTNRFPALDPPGRGGEAYRVEGAQEVLIETPVHGLDPSRMPVHLLERVALAYRTRYRALAEAHPGSHVILFKNRGAEAGNSLIHPHAQIYAFSGPAPEIERRETLARERWSTTGRCGLCGLESLEPDFAGRLVAENGSFRSVVPWAASTRAEVWIVPREHQASFGACTDEQLTDLAAILSLVLERLRTRVDDPAYNAVWHGGRSAQTGAEHLHWHIEIVPRAHKKAGFELATGLDVCPSDPLEDAAALRD